MKKILLVISFLLLFVGCSGIEENRVLGGEMKITTCPKSPNCVITDISDEKHYIEPIKFEEKTIEEINIKLVNTLEQLGGVILLNNETYIKAVFSSKIFKFKDIAEFEISIEDKKIYLKSAAQTGWSDFGVNRKRIEKIREIMSK